MTVLIIEDEIPAARRLERLLKDIEPTLNVVATLPSVEESLDFLMKKPHLDLIFSDIQLSDGLSFDIYKQIVPPCPIIFTTAFNDYAIQAFKTHAVDYLLKPIDQKELETAFLKFKNHFLKTEVPPQYSMGNLTQIIQTLTQNTPTPKTYRKRFLVSKGEEYLSVDVEDIAYFYSENRISRLVRKDGKWFPIDPNMDDLEQDLNPALFFRLNRQFIAQLSSIQKVSKYFNGKLKIELLPKPSDEVTVSRDKADAFKQCLDF
jgi:two-component system, LytTR family, response regulator LytT